MSQYKRNNNELLKEQCLEYLGGKICSVCKTNHLPICCYDFHHSKGAKEEEISKMIQRKRVLDDELKRELVSGDANLSEQQLKDISLVNQGFFNTIMWSILDKKTPRFLVVVREPV